MKDFLFWVALSSEQAIHVSLKPVMITIVERKMG